MFTQHQQHLLCTTDSNTTQSWKWAGGPSRVSPASRPEGSRYELPAWPDSLFQRLTRVFHKWDFFPGLLPSGLTPIRRKKKMERKTGGGSRECAQCLEHERERGNREREWQRTRPGRRRLSTICPWKTSTCRRMESLCAAYVYGAWSFPQRQKRQSSTTSRSSFFEVRRTINVQHGAVSVEEGVMRPACKDQLPRLVVNQVDAHLGFDWCLWLKLYLKLYKQSTK